MKIFFFVAKQFAVRGLVALLLFMLSACSLSPKVKTSPNHEAWQARQSVLSKIHSWKMQGRMAITSKEDSGTVTIIWEQNSKNFMMRITAPMGQGTIILDGDEQSVRMRDGQGHSMTADSAEQLLWEQTGWDIPLRGLRHWIIGLSTHQENGIQLDSEGQLLTLKTAGWDIQYLKYTKMNVGKKVVSLPNRMQLESENITIKLSINNWQVL